MINNPNPAELKEKTVTKTMTVDQRRQEQNETERLDRATARAVRFFPWLFVIVAVVMGIRTLRLATWQFAAGAVYMAIGAGVMFYTRQLLKRGQHRRAGYIIVAAFLLTFTALSLVISGVLVALILSILVFVNALGNMLLPRKMWRIILLSSLIAAILAVLIDLVPLPWTRFDMRTTPTTSITIYVLGSVAALVVLFQLLHVYRRIVRLGTRLAVIFGLVVVAAVTITILVSLFVVSNAVRVRSFDELQTTTQLKRNSIQSWIVNLHSELNNVLIEDYELTRARNVLLEEGAEEFRITNARELRTLFNNVIERNFNFTEISIVNLDGRVMLSSNVAGDDRWVDHEPWFLLGKDGEYVDQPRYSLSDGGLVMVFSQPLYDQLGFKIGVIAGKANLSKLSNLVSASPSGATGKTYLVAGNHEIVGEQRFVYSEGIEAALRGENVTAVYEDYNGVTVLGHYLRLPEFRVGFVNEIDEQEVLRTGRRGIMFATGFIGIGIEIAAVVVGIFVARSISTPLNDLVQTANRVSAGDLDLRADINTKDEVGILGDAFNSMTDQLQTLIANLEQRVQERTDGLAAVGEVTRATTSQLDISQLLPSVVTTVRERFRLYYVGLFLVEDLPDGQQVAVLRAATGEAGEQMLAEQWQLDVGMGSMIGNAIYSGQPRVRQSATESGPWQRNPYLPDTESELALPLRFGDDVLGAMTVQSTADNAFDDTMIELLQNMADQVAVAIENARLFTESQQALAQAQLVQQRYQSQAWRNYLVAQEVRGVSYSTVAGVETVSDVTPPALRDGVIIEDGKLLIPIIQGNQQVGVIGFEGKGDAWQRDEIELLQALTEQLSQAAETQRLLDETQLRAAREQTLGRVADSLRQSLDIETVLSTAAGEIREALGLDRIVVRLANTEQND